MSILFAFLSYYPINTEDCFTQLWEAQRANHAIVYSIARTNRESQYERHCLQRYTISGGQWQADYQGDGYFLGFDEAGGTHSLIQHDGQTDMVYIQPYYPANTVQAYEDTGTALTLTDTYTDETLGIIWEAKRRMMAFSSSGIMTLTELPPSFAVDTTLTFATAGQTNVMVWGYAQDSSGNLYLGYSCVESATWHCYIKSYNTSLTLLDTLDVTTQLAGDWFHEYRAGLDFLDGYLYFAYNSRVYDEGVLIEYLAHIDRISTTAGVMTYDTADYLTGYRDGDGRTYMVGQINILSPTTPYFLGYWDYLLPGYSAGRGTTTLFGPPSTGSAQISVPLDPATGNEYWHYAEANAVMARARRLDGTWVDTAVMVAPGSTPSAVLMPDGSLQVAMLDNAGAIVRYRSTDDGQTWSEVTL
jgi:hypothetical protein